MKRFKNILCCVDTETAEHAVSQAVELAIRNKAKLTVMDVIKPIPKAIGLTKQVSGPKELEDLVIQERVTGTTWQPGRLDLQPGAEYFVHIDAYPSGDKAVNSGHVPFRVSD